MKYIKDAVRNKAQRLLADSALFLTRSGMFVFSQMNLLNLEEFLTREGQMSWYRGAGEYVFREGMIADNLYIVKKGLFVAQKEVTISK